MQRRAAAEKPQRRVRAGDDLVPGTGRDQDRVTGTDAAAVAVDFHLAAAFKQVVQLLAVRVVMPLCLLPPREGGLRQGLVRRVHQFADRAPVLRRERLGAVAGADLHAQQASGVGRIGP